MTYVDPRALAEAAAVGNAYDQIDLEKNGLLYPGTFRLVILFASYQKEKGTKVENKNQWRLKVGMDVPMQTGPVRGHLWLTVFADGSLKWINFLQAIFPDILSRGQAVELEPRAAQGKCALVRFGPGRKDPSRIFAEHWEPAPAAPQGHGAPQGYPQPQQQGYGQTYGGPPQQPGMTQGGPPRGAQGYPGMQPGLPPQGGHAAGPGGPPPGWGPPPPGYGQPPGAPPMQQPPPGWRPQPPQGGPPQGGHGQQYGGPPQGGYGPGPSWPQPPQGGMASAMGVSEADLPF